MGIQATISKDGGRGEQRGRGSKTREGGDRGSGKEVGGWQGGGGGILIPLPQVLTGEGERTTHQFVFPEFLGDS